MRNRETAMQVVSSPSSDDAAGLAAAAGEDAALPRPRSDKTLFMSGQMIQLVSIV